jgi:hypothetical protein
MFKPLRESAGNSIRPATNTATGANAQKASLLRHFRGGGAGGAAGRGDPLHPVVIDPRHGRGHPGQAHDLAGRRPGDAWLDQGAS